MTPRRTCSWSSTASSRDFGASPPRRPGSSGSPATSPPITSVGRAEAGATRAAAVGARPPCAFTPRTSAGRRGCGLRAGVPGERREKKRDLFILAVLEEMTIPEVAAALAIPLEQPTRASGPCAPISRARSSPPQAMTEDERAAVDVLARARRASSPRASDEERVRRAIGAALEPGAVGRPATVAPRGPTWAARLLAVGAMAAASGGVG